MMRYFAIALLAACGGSSTPPTPAAPTTKAAAHWEYAGPEGPRAWPTINPACAGKEQSPVDLEPAVASTSDAPPKLEFAYKAVPLKITNNGHAVVSDEAGVGAKVMINGQTFELAQFHVHTPSEHEINGAFADLEIHFVHKNDKGEIAVVGLLAKKGAANATLAPFFANLPNQKDSPANTANGATVDLPGLIGNRTTYWAYEGSLTTPPCTEHVHWFVLDQPIEVSAEQIAAAKSAEHGATARPIQPLNARHLAHTH